MTKAHGGVQAAGGCRGREGQQQHFTRQANPSHSYNLKACQLLKATEDKSPHLAKQRLPVAQSPGLLVSGKVGIGVWEKQLRDKGPSWGLGR